MVNTIGITIGGTLFILGGLAFLIFKNNKQRTNLKMGGLTALIIGAITCIISFMV